MEGVAWRRPELTEAVSFPGALTLFPPAQGKLQPLARKSCGFGTIQLGLRHVRSDSYVPVPWNGTVVVLNADRCEVLLSSSNFG